MRRRPPCRTAGSPTPGSREDGGVRYWILPTRDGQAVWLVGLSADRGGGGGQTTFDHLAAGGDSATISLHRGRWRYAVPVADGIERVRAGSVERLVAGNVAILDLADRERHLELIGPGGSRILDLGPSDWDELERTSPG